jgi:lipid-A-disaccharide synthase
MEVMISAGDPSADIYAGRLICELKNIAPEIKVVGLGGKWIKKYADNFLYDLVGLLIFGPLDAAKFYFRLRKVFNNYVVPYIRENKNKISVVVPVDFYGFNIHLCKEAKRYNIPVVYYISPQVWATRPKRIYKLKRFVDKVIVLYPFEKEIYAKFGVNAEFYGHPLCEIIGDMDIAEGDEKRISNRINIGLFPGSRRAVVENHLPLFVETAIRITKIFNDKEIFFYLYTIDTIEEGLYWKHLKKVPPYVKINCIKNDINSYSSRKVLDLAIASSGTVTLENALLGIPTIIVYKTNYIFYLLARALIKTKYIGLPNILANECILPEFIQHRANAKNISTVVYKWCSNENLLNNIRKQLYFKITKTLCFGNVMRNTAQEIIKYTNVNN